MSTKPLPRTCWICGKAVKLEVCKIDEHGFSVHEECYVARIVMNGRAAATALENGFPKKPGALS
jgi:hypothetical protein